MFCLRHYNRSRAWDTTWPQPGTSRFESSINSLWQVDCYSPVLSFLVAVAKTSRSSIAGSADFLYQFLFSIVFCVLLWRNAINPNMTANDRPSDEYLFVATTATSRPLGEDKSLVCLPAILSARTAAHPNPVLPPASTKTRTYERFEKGDDLAAPSVSCCYSSTEQCKITESIYRQSDPPWHASKSIRGLQRYSNTNIQCMPKFQSLSKKASTMFIQKTFHFSFTSL